MLSPNKTGRRQRYIGIAILALTLAACAPDAWRPVRRYDAFLDQIRTKCRDTRLGSTTIPEMMPDAMTTVA